MGWFTDLIEVTADSIGGMSIPGVSSIADAVGSYIDEKQAAEQYANDKAWSSNEAQLNRDFQTSERLATQQFNIDMWNMNNEYNSPAKQVERLPVRLCMSEYKSYV